MRLVEQDVTLQGFLLHRSLLQAVFTEPQAKCPVDFARTLFAATLTLAAPSLEELRISLFCHLPWWARHIIGVLIYPT